MEAAVLISWGVLALATALTALSGSLLLPGAAERLCRRGPLPRGAWRNNGVFRLPSTRKSQREQRELLRQQLPLALRTISFALEVGYGLPQAFQQGEAAVREPLRSELMRLVWDFESGTSLEDGLRSLGARLRIPELRLVTVAFAVQHRSGGSMKSILDACCDSMRAQFQLQRDLQVQTAQARLSAKIVTLLPLGLFLAIAVLSPAYMAPFLGSPIGVVLLIVALLLDLAGVLVVRRILDLDQEAV
ncbi:MAG: type II secretion system F family protein [Coriobacteriales bacterium]|nr:type II secretion system F family protein [Coriobacteriales bacterium]